MIRDGLQMVLQGCVSSLTGQTRLAEFSLEGVEGKFRTVVLACALFLITSLTS